MPQVHHRPDLSRYLDRQQRRTEDLERRSDRGGRSLAEEVIPFANTGPMSPARTNPHPCRRGGQVIVVAIHADDLGAGDSTFQLVVSGSLVGNVITLPSGSSDVDGYVGNIYVSARAVLNLECLTAGVGLGNVGGHIVLKG